MHHIQNGPQAGAGLRLARAALRVSRDGAGQQRTYGHPLLPRCRGGRHPPLQQRMYAMMQSKQMMYIWARVRTREAAGEGAA